MVIYDAENQVLGRISTIIAKKLLKGEKVFVVNCEKVVITGKPMATKKYYLEKVHRGFALHGPFFPKTPDGIFRRTVRGMLPWHKPKGRKAFKLLKVFIGVPEEFKNKKFVKSKSVDASKLKCKCISLGKLSVAIGAKKRW